MVVGLVALKVDSALTCKEDISTSKRWWRKTVNDNLEEFMGIGEVGDFERCNGLIAWKFRFRFIMTHAYGQHQVMIFYVEI